MEFFPCRHPHPLNSLPTMASLAGAQDAVIRGVTFIEYPRADYLTFCERPPPNEAIDRDFDSTVLVSHDLADRLTELWPSAKLLHVDDPRAVFIDTLEYLQGHDLLGSSSLLPEAPGVSPDARICSGAIVEAGVQIDAGATVGNGAIIHAGTWVQRGAIIGDNCVIGGIGINAYVGHDGRRRGFPHLAGVIVGEEASLGAGCVIVRGILSSTRIGRRGILGNLCNIGHGVEIGENVWISVGTLIGGHAGIEEGATIAMGCTIRDNVRIGTRANLGMGSVVTKHVPAGASVFGNPARRTSALNAGPTR